MEGFYDYLDTAIMTTVGGYTVSTRPVRLGHYLTKILRQDGSETGYEEASPTFEIAKIDHKNALSRAGAWDAFGEGEEPEPTDARDPVPFVVALAAHVFDSADVDCCYCGATMTPDHDCPHRARNQSKAEPQESVTTQLARARLKEEEAKTRLHSERYERERKFSPEVLDALVDEAHEEWLKADREAKQRWDRYNELKLKLENARFDAGERHA